MYQLFLCCSQILELPVAISILPNTHETQWQWAGPTRYGGSEASGVENHEAVLQTAPAHSLSTNQNQRLPLEGWNLCHFLVDLQLVPVKLWRGGGWKDESTLCKKQSCFFFPL